MIIYERACEGHREGMATNNIMLGDFKHCQFSQKITSFMFQIAATKPPLFSLSPPAPTEEVTYKLSEFSGEVVLIKALICLLISSETTNKMTEQHRGWLLHALFPDMC